MALWKSSFTNFYSPLLCKTSIFIPLQNQKYDMIWHDVAIQSPSCQWFLECHYVYSLLTCSSSLHPAIYIYIWHLPTWESVQHIATKTWINAFVVLFHWTKQRDNIHSHFTMWYLVKYSSNCSGIDFIPDVDCLNNLNNVVDQK